MIISIHKLFISGFLRWLVQQILTNNEWDVLIWILPEMIGHKSVISNCIDMSYSSMTIMLWLLCKVELNRFFDYFYAHYIWIVVIG